MPLALSEIQAFLARTDYFRGRPPEGLARLAAELEIVNLAPAAHAFREGDQSDAWYLIYDGEVAVTKSGARSPHTLATLERGEAFGEMGLIDDAPRMGSVYAALPTRLLRLSREAFHGLLAANDPLATHLLMGMARILCQRQREITYILQEVVDDPGPQRRERVRVEPSLLAGLLHS